jgi:molecular chaperone GrpE (heat shock protein)
MRELSEPKLSKWPFFLGDALLLGAAWFIHSQSTLPMGPWQITFVVLCVVAGACMAIMPFLLEYHVVVRLAEAKGLATVVSQMRNIEAIAAQIQGATGCWQNAQDSADKTAAAAGSIAQRMTAEVKAFTEFMQRSNDAEKANLRLEVEKLRRAEADWLQVLVRVLDHVYALNQGALRSGQPNLIEQLRIFQDACRDAARRVGLTPFAAGDSEPFDAQRHRLLEDEKMPAAGAVVSETIAAGYTFQGRLVRPALVRLRESNGGNLKVIASAPGQTESQQSQFELESAKTKRAEA